MTMTLDKNDSQVEVIQAWIETWLEAHKDVEPRIDTIKNTQLVSHVQGDKVVWYLRKHEDMI